MRRRIPLPRPLPGALLVAATLLAPVPGDAQGLLDRVKRRVEQNVGRKVDEVVDCAMDDRRCIDAARTAGKPVRIDSSAARAPRDSGAGTAERPATPVVAGAGAWTNYDFVPGPRTLFHDDYTRDAIGDFPRRFEFIDGTLELVRWSERPWLRFAQTGKFAVPLAAVLPTRFTLEFDYYGASGECWIYPTGRTDGALMIVDAQGGGGFRAGGRGGSAEGGDRGADKVHLARLTIDGAYVKGYVDGARVVNVPNFGAERANKLLFYCDRTMAIGPIRIAEGGRPLYEALAADGRVATQGIYFDTGADRIRPESSPTLRAIAQMLAEHPELALVIEGHTDDTGAAAANLALSDRRAKAVVAALVGEHGVAATRLVAKGMGATKPAAPNTTPEGRQQNRRVELVKR